MSCQVNLLFNIFLSTSAIIFVSALLEGPNVCVRQETYTVTVNISEQKPYKHRANSWCLSFPPRCSTYRTLFKTIYKQQVKLAYQK